MSIDANKRIIQRYFDEFLNKGDLAAADSVLAPGFKCPVPGADDLDREGYKQFILQARTAFADGFRVQVQDVVAEGDRVAARFTLAGTHGSTWRGIPPTGKKINALSICVYRIEGGQIVEKWLLADNLGMLQQLGALPAQTVAAAR